MSVYRKIKELKYKKAVEKIVDYAIINLDENGRVEDWTDSAKKIFGYSISEVNVVLFDVLFAEEEKQYFKLKKLLDQAVKYGKTSGKYLLKRKDGSTFSANVLFNSIDDNKRVVGYTLIIGDLWVQKKIAQKVKDFKEKRSAKSNSSVEKEVKHQKVQLDLLTKEFNIVSNSLSHDLRAPLRAITGYLKIIEEDYADVLNAEGIRKREGIQRNSSKLENLI